MMLQHSYLNLCGKLYSCTLAGVCIMCADIQKQEHEEAIVKKRPATSLYDKHYQA